jgi:hypothetical protein
MSPRRYALLAAVALVTGCLDSGAEVPSGGAGAGGAGAVGGGGSGGSGGSVGSGAGGATMTDPPDPNDPLNKVVACTSGHTWSGVTGETMYPGDRCQGCHIWEISGTVYPTGHEQTLCNGLDGTGAGVTVVVSDAAGRVINLVPNSVGNFYYQGTVSYPFTAKVLRGSAVRAMRTPQTNAECNACHTPDGILGAPGRIVPPP